MRDKYNIIPMAFACGLHLAIFTMMILAFERSNANIPSRPLMIDAVLIEEDNLLTPQKKLAQERREAEEQKRKSDIRAEKIRINKKKKKDAEITRKAEIKRVKEQKIIEARESKELMVKQAKEAEVEKKRIEVELEKKRIEAEQERLDDIKRQRAENEKIRNDLEKAEKKAQLKRELSNEQKRLDALRSGALARYTYSLGRKIENNWVQPPSALSGISCVVNVRQLPGGEVISAVVETCNGDESVRRSVEAAVYKASPLPDPEDPSLFERNLRFIFEPYQ
ncbi:cell envelope integrity protein TolA [Woeseiaceae bacterium]|jgi:colicin import membrane protein|nr:cell envelope integrity protein TolA [Woeseiaceae bacterium]